MAQSPIPPAAPATPQSLLAYLDALGIEHSTMAHRALFTVEQSKTVTGTLPGAHIKNLFLRDKKERMWLLTALQDQPLDLKKLATGLGTNRLSFGSPERLLRHLGVLPGAVTPLAAINDPDAQVQVLLDRNIGAHAVVNCHPLVNTQTTILAPQELLRFLRATGHEPQLIDLAPFAP
jgi:Ala-tRNA(Pro) deacylase